MPSLAQALAHYEQVSEPMEMRALMLSDLFYLLFVGMGRTDMKHDFLFARCREVCAQPNGYLDLWAREHYKSTIITVGKTIQDVLANPEITVGIFSHSRPVAKAFLRQIKREFEANALLQELFPHILPPAKNEKRSWSENEGIIVRRESNPKEATIEAWGLVDGQPIGKHFALLIYDDVVTPESVATPEMIRKTTDAWRLSLNLGAHGGVRRMIGTRYHAADTYSAILEQGSVIPRIYPATKDASAKGEALFLSRASLDEKRRDMGPFVFACQMLQNPLADKAQGFSAEWFQKLDSESLDTRAMNRYILVDPASSHKEGSDYTAIWVIGLAADSNYYILDGIHDRLNLAERARALFELEQRWQALRVGYERYGMQADVDFLRLEMERLNFRFPLLELGGAMPKADRIRRLVPVFEQGRIFFPCRLMRRDREGCAYNLTEDFFRQEYLTFPVSSHDDMLDCLARILDPALGAVFPIKANGYGESLPRKAQLVSNLWN